MISTYPRKGTETEKRESEYTLPLISTYPRKGTETMEYGPCPARSSISTYPRKGTETREPSAGTYGSLRFQLIPARGRKLFSLCAETLFFGFQLIPAKPSQALRASSPEGRAFPAATYLVLSSPFRGSWHGVSRD